MASPNPQRSLSLRVATLPRDTNHYGTIFGGVILSYVDQAGFIEARRHGAHRWVTAALDRVEFKSPVHVGDVVNFYTHTVKTGTKSVTVQVEVEAELPGQVQRWVAARVPSAEQPRQNRA